MIRLSVFIKTFSKAPCGLIYGWKSGTHP